MVEQTAAMEIGAAVKVAMAEAGLTQVDVAEMLGVDQGRVSLLLRGARGARLKADEVLVIERACGLPAGEIFRRVDAERSAAVVDLATRRTATEERRAASSRTGATDPGRQPQPGRIRPSPDPEPGSP